MLEALPCSTTLVNTGDGVKIEALMLKNVSAALTMWWVSILVWNQMSDVECLPGRDLMQC